MRASRSASDAPSGPSGETLRRGGRTRSSGSSSKRLRSLPQSVARHALISASPSCTLNRWRSTDATTLSCASWGSAHSACAKVGPSVPVSTRRCAAADRCEANASRAATHCCLRPVTSAMPAIVRPSCRSASTTRASSIAVSVRGGAFADSSATFALVGSEQLSITTGTEVAPAARQCSSRLKPSITSSRSPSRTTRIGSSASAADDDDARRAPRRSVRRLVPSSSTETWCTCDGP